MVSYYILRTIQHKKHILKFTNANSTADKVLAPSVVNYGSIPAVKNDP